MKYLHTYAKLNAQKYGPGSDSIAVKLGDPFPIVTIGLNELKDIENIDSLFNLRTTTSSILYPIKSSNRVRSGVTLEKDKDSWKEVSFGGSLIVNLLVDTRKKYSNILHKRESDFYYIDIPALHLNLVAVKVDDKLKLIPILDNIALGLKADSPLDISALAPKLKSAAFNYRDPLPKK